jgi:hypothetical protein
MLPFIQAGSDGQVGRDQASADGKMVPQEGGEMVDLIGVESSMIAAAGYDPERRTLYVVFNSGKVYEYMDVPPEIYDGLMSAESKGSFMNQQIIDSYPYRQFRGWKRG